MALGAVFDPFETSATNRDVEQKVYVVINPKIFTDRVFQQSIKCLYIRREGSNYLYVMVEAFVQKRGVGINHASRGMNFEMTFQNADQK